MAKLAKHTPPPGWKNPLAPQQPLASARWILRRWRQPSASRWSASTSPFVCFSGRGNGNSSLNHRAAITATPASVGLKYDEISFDATETGVLQLNGWWIPADHAPMQPTPCSSCMTAPALSPTLCRNCWPCTNSGINIFAFDYRGFGKSVHIHPSEASTYEDADAAWSYLTDTRHLAPSTIVLDGVGLGAAIAAETARRHPQAPAVILEDPRPPVLDTLQSDPRTAAAARSPAVP